MNFLSTVLLAIILLVTSFYPKSEKKYYETKYYPQFHFTPERNWQSNPNGLIYFDGQYKMYYPYNTIGTDCDSIHWGHTTSTDLLHWEHQAVALSSKENTRDSLQFDALSGSVIVDKTNLLGKQTGKTQTLIAFYANKHCGQQIAYSTDKGKTWEKYESNPVIEQNEKGDARDPKVIWHNPSQKYAMVLYRKLTESDNSKGVSIYTSDNLIDWKWESHIPGFSECPDLIEFNVTNRPDETKWVLFDGDGSYLIGDFDGKKFSPESGKMKSDWGKNYSATKTWSNIPAEDGRIIQIAQLQGEEQSGMPFNRQMSFPCELSVTKSPTGYKLIRKPIEEINLLHGKNYSWENKNVIPGLPQNKLKKVSGDCLHIIAEFDVKTSNNFGFMLRHSIKSTGTEILYNVQRGTLSVLGCTVPLATIGDKLKLEILLDRTSIEVFANDGELVISNYFTPNEKALDLLLFTNGGELGIDNLDVYKMESIWAEEK